MSSDCVAHIKVDDMLFYCCLRDNHQPEIHVAIGRNKYGCKYVVTWEEKIEDDMDWSQSVQYAEAMA